MLGACDILVTLKLIDLPTKAPQPLYLLAPPTGLEPVTLRDDLAMSCCVSPCQIIIVYKAFVSPGVHPCQRVTRGSWSYLGRQTVVGHGRVNLAGAVFGPLE